ncbi:MAG: nucleotidyltransferase family protein [Acidimicrobiales bacterium]
MTTAAVVLAAGGGTRFAADGHKLLATIGGRPVVALAVEGAVTAGLDEVIVVTGAVDLTSVLPAEVTRVHNDAWAHGQATSLQAGVAAARSGGHDAVVVGLGDQPFVGPRPWAAVAASTAPIAVASYDGQRRNPVRLAAEVWPLLPTTGDEGARALMRVRPELVEAVPCQGQSDDIDTVEDLERWN